MTTQASDRLQVNGEDFPIKPFPLAYLNEEWAGETIDGKFHSRFQFLSTAQRRGYFARWAIEDTCLYLVDFEASDRNGEPLGMLEVFRTPKLFAFWFTGSLKSPLGKRLPGLYEPPYEKYNVWEFVQGRLTKAYVKPYEKSAVEAGRNGKRDQGLGMSLMDVLDQSALNQRFDELSEFRETELHEKLITALDALLEIKSGLVSGYDAEKDHEFDSMRDAWQYLTKQLPAEKYVELVKLRKASLSGQSPNE